MYCNTNKRNLIYIYTINELQFITTLFQCIRCGPGGDGRCVGPTLCCGPRIGCLMSSPGILSQCSDYSLTTPSSKTPTCLMSTGYGICTVDGICCNSGLFNCTHSFCKTCIYIINVKSNFL